jgi:hypothetical protein
MLEKQGRKDQQGKMGQRESLVIMEVMVMKDQKVTMEYKDHKDHQDHQVLRDQ